MKQAYTKVIGILLLAVLVLSLTGCGQIPNLKSLLPGAQSEAQEAQDGEEEAGPVSGDLSELQGSLKWVYLIEEETGSGQSSTGILVYNPTLAGYGMSSVTGTEAYIEWDDREFDLEAKASDTAEGWYHSAQLAMNIRNEKFVLTVYLLHEDEEATEIRLENPKIAVLPWPSLTSKGGIKMEKTGSSYTFSANTLSDLFTEPAPGIFSYRIKDCTDCNVKLDGNTLQYKSISNTKASFVVEITDPAGETKQVEVSIGYTRNLNRLILPAVLIAAGVAAAAALVWILRKKGRRAEKEQIIEAQQAILDVTSDAEPLLEECREVSKNADSALKDALHQLDAYGGNLISKDVIEDAAKEAKDIVNSPVFETLRISVSDLNLMSGMIDGGDKAVLAHEKWTKELFLKPESRKKELDKIRKDMQDLRKELKRANDKMSYMTSFTHPGKDSFRFSFDILIHKDDTKWICRIEKDTEGQQKMRDLFFRSRGKRITSAEEIVSETAAGIQFFSQNEERILIVSECGVLREIHGGVAEKDGENSIWLQRGQSIRFAAGEGTEVIEIRSEEE